MTPQDLIASFEVLAEAPDGIQRLRELVLQLAVRGKLVPQNPEDEPAEVLLERIAKEKALLVREKKSRRPKPLPPVAHELIDENVPAGWERVQFPQIARWAVGSGFAKKYQGHSDLPILFCKVSDMNRPGNERFIHETAHTIDEAIRNQSRANVHSAGTVIFPKIGGAIATNKRRILIRQSAIDNNCLGLTPYSGIQPAWLFMLLSSIDLAAYQSGTSVPALSQGTLETLRMGLPPLAEQHRIVARVDALMAHLDRLEAAREAREATRAQLRDAALTALRDADDAEEVETAWARIAENMDDLFTDPADVEPLRQAILQLAVRGRLVPQDPEDEPAGVLLERIAKEKARLVREKKIRKPKVLPPIEADEVPFRAPDGWAWCRLQDIGDWGAGATPRRGNARYFGGEINWFKSGELPDGPMMEPSTERVTMDALRECSLRENVPGDVLIAMYGATIGKLGLLGVPGTTNQAVCACTCHQGFYNRFLFLLLHAWRASFVGRGEGGAQPNISKIKIISTVAPVPPLREQHRIVARVDALMARCDDLEARLTSTREAKAGFAAAAVHHLET